MDILKIYLISLLALYSISLQAQENEDFTQLDKIEAEINRQKVQTEATANLNQNNDEDLVSSKNEEKSPDSSGRSFKKRSDLYFIESFEDLAIIHPRFQPKSKRFQFSLGGNTILNDPWFNQFGLSLRSSFHFNEFFGFEIAANSYSGSSTTHAKDLASQLGVLTASLVQPKSYLGAHLIFTPLYGKMSLFNQRIIPFDIFVTIGAGTTSLEGARAAGASTYHLGAGQLFAISRHSAFRWDIAVNMFTAQSRLQLKTTSTQNVAMTFSYSYFLPEVRR